MLGRETFADEVVWTDGWPVLTGHLEPARRGPPVTEELDGDALPPSWVGAAPGSRRRSSRARTAAGG